MEGNLIRALDKGDLEFLKIYVEKYGVDEFRTDFHQRSLLFTAVEYEQPEIVEWLLEKGA